MGASSPKMRIEKRKWNRGLVPVPCIEGFLNCNTAASAMGESRGKKREPAGILQALFLDIKLVYPLEVSYHP